MNHQTTGLLKLEQDKIVILDFGSQYTHLIARRVRENKVYCEINPYNTTAEKLKDKNIKGIILSGSPYNVYSKDAPLPDKYIFNLNIPILGICYGLQVMAHLLGGEVEKSEKREYGNSILFIKDQSSIFRNIKLKISVWMSHGDRVRKLPDSFKIIGESDNSPAAAIEDRKMHFYGVQFHPEVVHTTHGARIIKNFLYEICKCKGIWTMESYIEHSIKKIKEQVKDDRVICGLSGGVDSSTTAVLLDKAIGDKLICMFVNNGFLRLNEENLVIKTFKEKFKMNLIYVDASKIFLSRLKGITDPEKKRKIIGHTFIEIFEKESKKLKDIKYLAQGTLYPDVIESTNVVGPSATIKTHHNVGGLPMKIKFKLIEPLRELFKDEVRILGRKLGLPAASITRHPFPGPGLAIRIIGEVTPERLKILRFADSIVEDEIRKAGFYKKIWQGFAVLLPVKTVGVMGDERTYENVIAIRAVKSEDGMTADWSKLPYNLLGKISNRIINEVKGVNRVVYDISSKPPATIEWE